MTGEETDERRVVFKTVFIRDGAEPTALEPPRQPLTGESHGHLLARCAPLAKSLN